jgi:hypothetical protein
MTLCSFVEVTAAIIRTIIMIIDLMMEAIRISETSVYFYETKRRHVPDGCHVQVRRRENLNSENLINASGRCLCGNVLSLSV